MSKKLTGLVIEEVSFVDKGANPGALVMLMKRDDAPVTKTEGGQEFAAADYAYAPDARDSATWKLRLTKTPGGDPDAATIDAAVAALSPHAKVNKVDLPPGDRAAVIARVKAAWLKANPTKTRADLPSILKGDFSMDIEKRLAELEDKFTKQAAELEAAKAENTKLKKAADDAEAAAKLTKAREDFAGKLPAVLRKAFDAMDAEGQDAFMKEYQAGGSVLTKALETMQTDNEALRKRLEALEGDGELEAVRKELAAMPGVDAAKHAPMVIKLRKAAGQDGAKDFIETLRASAAQAKAGNMLFSVIGKDGGDAGSAMTKLEKAAAEIRKADPKLTKEQAVSKALENDPALYDEYNAENQGRASAA